MKSSLNNMASIDDGIKTMHKLIRECSREPEKPDAYGGKVYTKDKLGKLGEQYVECLFREMGITKLPQGKKPSPDFKILVNGKELILEVKTISNLYEPFVRLLREIAEEENDQTFSSKVKTLFKNYDLDITPFDVHREHKRELKKELKRVIRAMKLPVEKVHFVIKCKMETYELSIRNAKGAPFAGGWEPDETKTLDNVISKNKEQIGSSDILLIILLNRTIEQDELLDFFYNQISLSLQLIQEMRVHSQNSIPQISQYRYEQTIWGRKFEDEEGKVHTVDERLKCVVVLRPSSKTSLIFPSIKHFEKFSAPEYLDLRLLLQTKGFKCKWATHEVNLRTSS